MKNILVLHTGGTIAMVQEKDGTVTLTPDNPLLGAGLNLPDNITLQEENILNLPSPHITLEDMLLLRNRIEKGQQNGIDGFVITHGTDTLEETAYFLDITLENKVPVVLTGAMRSSNEIGSDGLYNFINAVTAAASENAKGQGVLVVMNDEIHAAEFVTKTHTTNVDTFRTPTFGPVGIILKDEVYFVKQVVPKSICPIGSVSGNVHLIKAHAGMNSALFDLLNCPETDGIIIEALGAGNLPPSTVPALKRLLENSIPIALVSRCSNGMAQDIYDYHGGGVPLKKMGITFVKGITGAKARIRMLVGLNHGYAGKELSQYMAN